MGRRAKAEIALDVELADLAPELRWREWMGRVEAVIFASPEPVPSDVLARVVGKGCNLDLIIDDIKEELRVRVGRRRWRLAAPNAQNFAEAIQAATGLADQVKELSRAEAGVLMAIAHFQPVIWARGQPRPHREPTRCRPDRCRAAQPAARRALRLCHYAGVFVGIRVREPARFA